jgi:hypothetical protein
VVKVLRLGVRTDDLENGAFRTTVLNVLDAYRALATASAFVDPGCSWFAGSVFTALDQFAQGTREVPPGTGVEGVWSQTIWSRRLSPRGAMLDRLLDVSAISGSRRQLRCER